VEGDYQRVVPPSSLHGAAGTKQALVAAREQELHQALQADECDGCNE
jgi:hypothetical protein